MTNGWQEVPLGKLLKRADRFEKKDELQTYRFAGTYSFARGIFAGVVKEGSTFGLDKIQRIKKGDFIYCKIMAWEGAFGIAPDSVDDCVMSGAFVTYEVDQTQIDPKFLDYYFKQEPVWKSIGSQSTGTNVRRRSLHPTQFEKATIPCPPLTEQRRIVAHIESLASRVNEAQRLREEVDVELNTLLISMAHRSDMSKEKLLEEGWVEVRLGEIIKQVRDRVRVEPNAQYPNLGIYSFARGLFHKQPIDGNLTSAKELYRVHKGQFIYSRLFAFEGACGYITNEFDEHYVSGEYPTFDCDPEKVKPEFLFAYFKSLATWKEISAGSKGLGDRRQRVQPEKFLEHKLLLPPLDWQERISVVMRTFGNLRELQSETENELNALMPSILDRAFRGKLT